MELFDPTTEEQMETFHRRLRQTTAFYQTAAVILAEERMTQELRRAAQPAQPVRVRMQRRVVQVSASLLRGIRRAITSKETSAERTPTLIVIRSTTKSPADDALTRGESTPFFSLDPEPWEPED